MASPPGRLRAVLRLAQHKEERALKNSAAKARGARDAGAAAEESQRQLEELGDEDVSTAENLRRVQQKAELRAHRASLADEALKEMLVEQLEAREQLRGAIRRRRSLEELESRRIATQAGMAAHAAQRALDELAVMRKHDRDQERE